VKDNDTTSRNNGNADRRACDSGKLAEDRAARFLEQQGLRLLARNYYCRGGEIDLVCRSGKVLVFVEVRLRGNAAYGGAAASITPTKQRRIILAAQHYLNAHSATESDCRFDCILFDGPDSLSENRIEWMRDAFSAD
jgi:putative endonuclease